jgi:uncharacterized repeat protein (TIGR03803 family)
MNRCRVLAPLLCATAAAIFMCAAVTRAYAQVSFQVLHPFTSAEGYDPHAGLIQAIDGDFYGTTTLGGGSAGGSIFRMAHDGTVTVLHSFSGTDGVDSEAELIQAQDGHFYGTTAAGGAFGFGTVFEITTDGTFTVLHAFAGGSDGATPVAALIQTADGTFYGTTKAGGSFNQGTVFKMDSEGTVTVLHAFAGGTADGAHPWAALIAASDGDFYGTTADGGGSFPAGYGTIFRMTPDGTVTVMHRFVDGGGKGPLAPLIQAIDGNFYGTTQNGGDVTGAGGGTIFRMALDGTFAVLQSGTTSAGQNPTEALLQGTDRRLYGTLPQGAGFSSGSVFQMSPTGTITTLHAFAGGADGISPHGGLLQGADRSFYGTTEGGGTGPGTCCGVAYRVTLTRPGAPTGFGASLTTDGQVQLGWTAASGATSYTIKRSTSAGAEAVIASGVTTTSYLDVTSLDNTSYYYVVSAENALTEGPDSNEVAISVPLRMARFAPGNFDRDGKADLTMFRPSNAHWYVLQSQGGYSYADSLEFGWGLPGDVPIAGDFDGDGQTDLAVYRPSNGTWYILFSASNYSLADAASIQWGLPGDVPLSADFDGDGINDLVVYRPSNATWYVLFSSGHFSYTSWTSYQWGLPGDVPVAADFDGDRKTDLVVYRPSNGMWYIRFSSSNYSYETWTSYQWGLPGDIPMAEDFDADGKADLAVYRPSDGTWYVRFSSSGYSYTNAASYQWGLPGDVPVLADVDGDRKADLVVWRPSNGTWYVRYSSTGYSYSTWQSFQWGLPGDTLPFGGR